MKDLTPDHPAVEAATPEIHSISLREYTPEDCHEAIVCALTAALPHLTADDLRHTPAGRALMAEAWDRGHQAGWEDRHEDWLCGVTPSGYTQDTPSPYRQQVSKREDGTPRNLSNHYTKEN